MAELPKIVSERLRDQAVGRRASRRQPALRLRRAGVDGAGTRAGARPLVALRPVSRDRGAFDSRGRAGSAGSGGAHISRRSAFLVALADRALERAYGGGAGSTDRSRRANADSRETQRQRSGHQVRTARASIHSGPRRNTSSAAPVSGSDKESGASHARAETTGQGDADAENAGSCTDIQRPQRKERAEPRSYRER